MRRNSSSNRLFALEQSLQSRCQPDTPPASSDPNVDQGQDPKTVKAMAFDYNEAIELTYTGNYATGNYANAQSADDYATAQSVEDTDSWAMALGNAAEAYEVESFETASPVSDPDPLPPAPAPPAPVQATIVPDYAPQPHKSAQPEAAATSPTASSAYVQAASNDEDLWSADAAAFAADIQSILKGEKTYDPTQQQVIETTATPVPPDPAPAPPPAPPPPPDAAPATPPTQSHAIFDQIAKNMAYATAYDLGDLSMAQRFDAFDRMLGYEQSDDRAAPQAWQPELESQSFGGLEEDLATVVPLHADLANSAGYKTLLNQLIAKVPLQKPSAAAPTPTGKKAAPARAPKGRAAPAPAPAPPSAKAIVSIELEGAKSAEFCLDGNLDLYIVAFRNTLNDGKWQLLPEVNYAKLAKPEKLSYSAILTAIYDSQKWTTIGKEQQSNFVDLVAVIAEAARFELIYRLIDRVIQAHLSGTRLEVPYQKLGPIVNNWSKLREKQENRPYIELSAIKNSENLAVIAPTDTDKAYIGDLLTYIDEALG